MCHFDEALTHICFTVFQSSSCYGQNQQELSNIDKSVRIDLRAECYLSEYFTVRFTTARMQIKSWPRIREIE